MKATFKRRIAKGFLLFFPTLALSLCSCIGASNANTLVDREWQDNASVISVTAKGKSYGYTASVYESMKYKRNGATAISIHFVYDECEERQIDYKGVEYLIIMKGEDKII